MSEEEQLSHEEIKERLRTGWTLDPRTPGLQEAARELIRPIVEQMDGREIIYRCRVPWLMRVSYLEVDDDGFRAVATPVQEIRDDFLSRQFDQPLDFGARWSFLHLSGSAVSMNMITDHFYTDPALVAEVKAAAAHNAPPSEIASILARGSGER